VILKKICLNNLKGFLNQIGMAQEIMTGTVDLMGVRQSEQMLPGSWTTQSAHAKKWLQGRRTTERFCSKHTTQVSRE